MKKKSASWRGLGHRGDVAVSSVKELTELNSVLKGARNFLLLGRYRVACISGVRAGTSGHRHAQYQGKSAVNQCTDEGVKASSHSMRAGPPAKPPNGLTAHVTWTMSDGVTSPPGVVRRGELSRRLNSEARGGIARVEEGARRKRGTYAKMESAT